MQMRNSPAAACGLLLSIGIGFHVLGCGGSGSGTTGPNCGPGTSNQGGVCQVDPALVLVLSQSSSEYWKGYTNTNVNLGLNIQFNRTITGSPPTLSSSGSGLGRVTGGSGGQPVTNITWSEGPSTDSIQLTNLSTITQFTNIVPNSQNATSFTCNMTGGFGTLPISFVLTAGTP